jgi:hypothetical protein
MVFGVAVRSSGNRPNNEMEQTAVVSFVGFGEIPYTVAGGGTRRGNYLSNFGNLEWPVVGKNHEEK